MLAQDVLTDVLKSSVTHYCLICQRSPGPKATHPQLLHSKTLPKVELIGKRSLFWVSGVLGRSEQILRSPEVRESFFLSDTTLLLILKSFGYIWVSWGHWHGRRSDSLL